MECPFPRLNLELPIAPAGPDVVQLVPPHVKNGRTGVASKGEVVAAENQEMLMNLGMAAACKVQDMVAAAPFF
jgi:hypothetical protein